MVYRKPVFPEEQHMKRIKPVARFYRDKMSPRGLRHVGFQMEYKKTDGLRVFRPRPSDKTTALYCVKREYGFDFLSNPKPIKKAGDLKPYRIISFYFSCQRCHLPNVPPVSIAEVVEQIYIDVENDADTEDDRQIVAVFKTIMAFEIIKITEKERHNEECSSRFSNSCSCEHPYEYEAKVRLYRKKKPITNRLSKPTTFL